MSQNEVYMTQLTSTQKRNIRRRFRREQRAMAVNASENTVLVNYNQSQPLNVYPDCPNVWAPNLAMQSMQQDPGLYPYPQTNTSNNIANFGPWTDFGNSFQQNYPEQPFPHENYNMGTQPFVNQSNQGKKMKNKLKPKQQPKKKLKTAELSFEEKQQREAELRVIEQKYRQAVMIQRSIQGQVKPPPVPKKSKAKVTPSQPAPVRTVVPIVSTAVPPTPPVLDGKKPRQRTKKNKKNQNHNQVQVVNVYNSGVPSTSQYQAPHQDEPEDLTDDLAPNMAGGQQQPGTQPRAVTAENKLNFKFQRSVPKNPDWSEYQNKFRRIGGGSPDPPADADKVTQDPNQSVSTDITKPRLQSPSVTAPQAPQPTMTTTQQKTGLNNAKQPVKAPAPVPAPAPPRQVPAPPRQVPAPAGAPQRAAAAPKVQALQQPAKQKPNETLMKANEMRMRSQQKNNLKYPSNPFFYPYDIYPKGIPKSFLQPATPVPQPSPQSPGVPKPDQSSIKELPYNYVKEADYQAQPSSQIDLPSWILASQAAQDPPPDPNVNQPANAPMFPPMFAKEPTDRPYSPTDVYAETPRDEGNRLQAQPSPQIDLPSWILASQAAQDPPLDPNVNQPANAPMFPPMFAQEPTDRPYSPTDVYAEVPRDEEPREGSESPDLLQSGQKRPSAFSRLGPLAQPKKPKLTINLMLNKEQAVREVVDESDAAFRYVPVHLRTDMLASEDETVQKYLPFWPWKKHMQLRKTVSARFSKSVMILEQEQMETGYEKNSLFIQVSVKGYPKTWNKEDVLDAILECVKGKSFIPLFIEFTPQECKFLVIRCRDALIAIHKAGFYVHREGVELTVSISLTDTSLNQIDLIPRLVLRKRLMAVYDAEKTLDLSDFFTEKDVSHFVYFPLNRHTNQSELIQVQSAVAWEYLTDLNLSRNRLTSISGFNLCKTTPRLKRLDLSHNCLDKLTTLLPLRELPLRALTLEGNPLCHDYIDSAHYVKVVRMIFCEVMELDGVRITLKGDLPPMKRNYCPEDAAPLLDKFLETFFPLLESYEDRAAIEDMYDKDAVLTITFRYKLRYGTAYRYFRNLFVRARSLEEGELDSVAGAGAIAALLLKWPAIEHDRYAMTVDVLHHDECTTVVRVGGVLKLTAASLAEDEHLLTFARTLVLHARGAEYKIHAEMLYWDVPREEVVRHAFNVTTVRPKPLSLKLESPPDDDLKSKLVDIFVKLADIDKKRGARCLELRNWDLRSALEYYIALLKLDDLSALSLPKESTPAPQAS